MKKEILTGILGLVVTALAFGNQSGNSLMNTPTIDLDSIVYIEEEKPVVLGFETAQYLPEEFNAYSSPVNFMDISFIEEDPEIVLAFDKGHYLPKAFDPYKEYFDLNSIPFLEEEECFEIDFELYETEPVDPTAESTF